MTPWLDDGDVRLYHGDNLDVLRQLPDRSVHMCATSPPFYGLRDYGTGLWDGGDPDCDHAVRKTVNVASSTLGGGTKNSGHQQEGYGAECGRCGASRVDQQIGLEDTPDQWVERLVQVFREVRRVLRDDGTLWVEIGDSYGSSGDGGTGATSAKQNTNRGSNHDGGRHVTHPTKPKDLLGQPWLLAFALRADGWYLRSEIIWARPNPMPESVTDRPTKSHSTVFLLSKQPRYFYDADAIRERVGEETRRAATFRNGGQYTGNRVFNNSADKTKDSHGDGEPGTGANARTVWTIPTQPTPFAHFATWPEALVRRMILAGTSERGCCSVCGAPWVRQTEIDDAYRARLVQRFKPEGIGAFLRDAREAAGLKQSEVAGMFPSRTGGLTGCVSNWELGKNQPTPDQWEKLRDRLGFGPEMDEAIQAWHIYETGVWKQGPEWGVKRAPEAASRNGQTVGWSPSCACVTIIDRGNDDPEIVPTPTPVPCTVLDPFAGSATTMLVARNHGRHSIGIELNADYLKIAAKRLQQLSLLST